MLPDHVHIVLAHDPYANCYRGLTEFSFAMDWSDSTACMWWSGTTDSVLGTHYVDGKADAERARNRYANSRPDWTITVYDAHAADCPVQIDWPRWEKAFQSGRGRFDARNARFSLRALPTAP